MWKKCLAFSMAFLCWFVHIPITSSALPMTEGAQVGVIDSMETEDGTLEDEVSQANVSNQWMDDSGEAVRLHASAPGSDDAPDDEKRKPVLMIYIDYGEGWMNGNLPHNLSAYSVFRVKACLVGKDDTVKVNVTDDCDWSSSNSDYAEIQNSIQQIDGEEAYPIRTYGPHNNITISAIYKGELECEENARMASRPVNVVNLKIKSNADVLTYAALSQLAYTDFTDAQRNKTIGQILQSRDTNLIDRDKLISEKEGIGATFSSFYSACASEWIYIEQSSFTDGLVGVLFYHPKTGKYVISYRGTDDGDDLWTDICLGVGVKITQQFNYALELYDRVKNRYGSNIVLTGHSLGGGLANAVSVLRGARAYTFNAPSTMVSVIVTYEQDFAGNFRGLDDDLRMDYVNPKDWIGNIGVGDNVRFTLINNLSTGIFSSSSGGKIDRTFFIADQSIYNGIDKDTWLLAMLAPYHSFRQMLVYNRSSQSIAILENNKTAPTVYSYVLRDRQYVLGSRGGDTLTYNNANAIPYVFGGEGNDTIKSGKLFRSVKNFDVICGGRGEDTIYGNYGNQQYIYSKGDGFDTIYDGAGNDQIWIYGYDKNSITWGTVETEKGDFYEIFAGQETIMRVQENGIGEYVLYVEGEVLCVGDEPLALKRYNSGKVLIYCGACPTDMYIYDGEGNVVCELKNGEIMDEIRSYGHFVVEEYDGEYVKTATLYDEGYTVKMIGVGEGTMQYSCTILDGENIQTRTIDNIPVHNGASYTTFDNFEEGILQGDLDGDGVVDYNAVYTPPQEILLNTQNTELSFGETVTLEAVVAPDEALQYVYWSSSDTSVALVDENGTVTAVGMGSAEITATCAELPELQAVCQVTVPETVISLNQAEISGIEASYVYSGEYIESDITVRYGDLQLAEEIDYSVEYENNLSPGIASVTVTGMGMFADSITQTFEILPMTVEQKVEKIVTECLESGAEKDYDIVLWLHDWLIDHADYDYTLTEYGADGVLLKGTGVCQSYTLAFQALLDQAGIENIVVLAPEMDHAWNIVKVKGTWTHIDCTWDDPNWGGYENHQYFGLSDADMSKDHIWDKTQYPECFAIQRDIDQSSLPEPDTLTEPMEGIDFTLWDDSGNVLTRQDFSQGNTLLIYGRPTCSNTMGFIQAIAPWKSVLDANDLNVVVVFESAEQVAESADQLPFTCTYEADSGYERWEFCERAGLSNGYTYPLLVLQNPQGYVFYISTGYVYEPERMLSTALQELPQTDEISTSPLYMYSDNISLENSIKEAVDKQYSTIKLCNMENSAPGAMEIELVADILNQYGIPMDSVYIYGNVIIIELSEVIQGKSIISGMIMSYGDMKDNVVLRLLQGEDEIVRTEIESDTEEGYCLNDIPYGHYTLEVSKVNHVTRCYDITVSEDKMIQDVKICLLGDITGDGQVNTRDCNRLYAHICDVNHLNGYELQCADVTGMDGQANTRDWDRLYAHITEISLLW